MDYLKAEIGEGGIIRVTSPEAKPGDVVHLPVEPKIVPHGKEDWWEALQEVFSEADKLDFPRRTHEEIIHDLHELRG